MVLVKYNGYTNDNFAEGFVIATKEEANEWLDKMSKLNENFSFMVGMNEEFEMTYSCGNELIEDVEIIDLSNDEYLMMCNLFSDDTDGYGNFEFFYYFDTEDHKDNDLELGEEDLETENDDIDA